VPHVNVLGIRVAAIDIHWAVDEIERRIDEDVPGYLTFTGVHGVMESQGCQDLIDIHNNAALTCPDGMPLVWAARYAGVAECSRVYGPDLMLAACSRSVDRGWRHFFYGGGDGVAEQLVAALSERYPGLVVAGTYTPPFRPLTVDEERDIAELINSSRADVVWVGLSTPKQERWMAAFRDRVDAPVLLGVGAAFDMHAGLLRQAPPWLQRSGLEWAYRLLREPRRLWRRYLSNNPRFVARILRDRPRLEPELAVR